MFPSTKIVFNLVAADWSNMFDSSNPQCKTSEIVFWKPGIMQMKQVSIGSNYLMCLWPKAEHDMYAK